MSKNHRRVDLPKSIIQVSPKKKAKETKKHKDRRRNSDPEKYTAQKRNARHKAALRKDQAISRSKRKSIRSEIEEHVKPFIEYKDRHLLFVFDETPQTEKVLLKRYTLNNGLFLLALPVLNEEIINQFLADIPEDQASSSELLSSENEALKELVKTFYGVTSNDITHTDSMIIFRNCTLVNKKNNLFPTMVKPYNRYMWYTGESLTLNGFKVFNGNRLNTFFNLDSQALISNKKQTYVYMNTLTELLYYKAIQHKIPADIMLFDIACSAKRNSTNISLASIVSTWYADFMNGMDGFMNSHHANKEARSSVQNQDAKPATGTDIPER